MAPRLNWETYADIVKALRRLLGNAGTTNEATREEWLESVLSRLPAGARILDAGAGTARYRRYCTHLDYVAQDFAEYDGSGDGQGLHSNQPVDYSSLDIVSDIASIPEPDASFDAIMCIEVLEHVSEPLKALDELARLLKPRGKLVITAPFASVTHLAPYYFSTGFSRYFYEHHLPSRHLRVVEIHENGGYFDYLAQELRRLPSMSAGFAGRRPGLLATASLALLLRSFGKLSRRDSGSASVLCFGLHVIAVKDSV